MPTDQRAHNIIAGKPVSAIGGATFERWSPLDGSLVAHVPRSQAADVAAAVVAARSAWRAWAARSAVERGNLLRDVVAALDARRDELLDAVRAETGKPRRDLEGEFVAARELAFFLASEARRMYGRTIPSAVPGKYVATERAPVGVAGLVVAANTPLPNYAWKVLPALLCGNTFVLKPSEHTPVSAELFVRALHDAGVPGDVANLVHGTGAEAGQALVDHPGVDLVSFTGGVAVGRTVAARAGARLAKTCLELGGSNPFVVCDDADLENAADHAVASAFSNAGQRCAAASRFIVSSAVVDEFLELVTTRTRALVVGAGEDADIGPVVGEAQARAVVDSVAAAVRDGASVVVGGGAASGCFVPPTLLLVPPGRANPLADEVFGPVATVEIAADFEEALALADDTEYGLTAAIHTADHGRARAFVDHVQAGMVAINGPTFGSEPHTPFGGFRASGNGFRECGTEVLDFYSEWKAVNTWMAPR